MAYSAYRGLPLQKCLKNIAGGGKSPLLHGTSDSRQGCPSWVTGHHARAGGVFVFRDGLLNQLSECSLGPNSWLLLVKERYIMHAGSAAVRLRAITIGLDVLFSLARRWLRGPNVAYPWRQ